MDVLFVSSRSHVDSSSYTNRIITLKEGIEELGVRTGVLYLRKGHFDLPHLMDPLKSPRLIKAIRSYDVIVGENLVSSYALFISNKHARSYVHDVHGDVVLENRLIRNSIADLARSLRIVESMLMEAVAYRRSQYFMACSGPLRQHLACRGFDPEKIVVIRNGVDTRLFKPCCCSTNNENFIVTYAGSFQKWQGIDNLLEAAELLPESNIKFKIVGFKDPILKSKIKKRLKGNGILIDDVPQFELVKHLCESDILVIPRSWNPAAALAFPTKFAEYCAVGKPVIVTQVDETSHFVEHYDCGFVCEPTPESIARTITEAYNSSHTVLLRKGRNARVLAVEEFDRLVIGRQLLEFLSGTVQVA